MVMKMKNYDCLLIKTKDQRKFFTHEKNLELLLEFSKIFKAEISKVNVEEAEVLELEELAPAFCNMAYKISEPIYKILEIKVPNNKKKRKEILSLSKRINNFIKKEMIQGKDLSLKEIKNKFNSEKLTTACLCAHFTKVRNELEKKGYRSKKVKGGTYRLITK